MSQRTSKSLAAGCSSACTKFSSAFLDNRATLHRQAVCFRWSGRCHSSQSPLQQMGRFLASIITAFQADRFNTLPVSRWRDSPGSLSAQSRLLPWHCHLSAPIHGLSIQSVPPLDHLPFIKPEKKLNKVRLHWFCCRAVCLVPRRSRAHMVYATVVLYTCVKLDYLCQQYHTAQGMLIYGITCTDVQLFAGTLVKVPSMQIGCMTSLIKHAHLGFPVWRERRSSTSWTPQGAKHSFRQHLPRAGGSHTQRPMCNSR